MAVKHAADAPPESDRFDDAPHPRDTYALFGHEKAETELLDAYRQGRLPQAWILGGPQGIGKATLAWRMVRFLSAHPDPSAPEVQQAKNLAVDSRHPSAQKISALAFGDLALLRREWNEKTKKHATRIAVEDVRRALHIFEQAAGSGGWRMCVIDSADDFNPNNANALLKLIEEPPPKSLFLIVAHQPGRVLPTIRSRCRRLMLQGLETADLQGAVTLALQASGGAVARDELARVSEKAEGSAREALRLLSQSDSSFDAMVEQALAGLPRINWRLVHRIADGIAGREGETQYEAFLRAIFAFLSTSLRRRRDASPSQLAPYAEAWEKLERDARDLQIFNLDKRAFALGVFSALAEAQRAANPGSQQN